ncbi:hypothetical protein CsSME_00042420 [Camellia sinensis var. sinensis]
MVMCQKETERSRIVVIPAGLIYLLDIYLFYTIISAVWGFLLGARDRLGEIRSLGAVHKLFEKFPEAFIDKLHVPLSKRTNLLSNGQKKKKKKRKRELHKMAGEKKK